MLVSVAFGTSWVFLGQALSADPLRSFLSTTTSLRQVVEVREGLFPDRVAELIANGARRTGSWND